MFTSRFSGFTTSLIYIGTFLLSVLSFFTTYYGLTILLAKELAFIGSLGLQMALLGVAWNLMRTQGNRVAYLTVFVVAASFSIFFSYAAFDSELKDHTRSFEARSEYSAAVRPVLDSYARSAEEAAVQSQYQVDRLERLLVLEQEKGWATVVDEGTEDPLIQEVLDGARRTIESWTVHQGRDYNQGTGKGIIYDFLQGQIARVKNLNNEVRLYTQQLDSIALAVESGLPVKEQYAQINQAWVLFPRAQSEMLLGRTLELPIPPDPSAFAEKPANRQHAFRMVIEDLAEMDWLTAFALFLAIAVDLIVMAMAFAASLMLHDMDYVLDKVKASSFKRVRKLSLGKDADLDFTLDQNLEQLRRATNYRRDLGAVLEEYRTAQKPTRVTLRRGPEKRKLRVAADTFVSRIYGRLKDRIKPNGRKKKEESTTSVEELASSK